MSTRSTITAKLNDGSYRAVYCHWDGYVEKPGVGWMLQQHYNSQELAEEVTSLGALSSLDASCGAPPGHSYENSAEGCTVAYHRDRGQAWHECEPGVGATYEAAVSQIGTEEYNYLWNGSAWQLMSDDPKDVLLLASRGSVPA